MKKTLLLSLVLISFIFGLTNPTKHAYGITREDISRESEKLIPGQYLVVYKDNVANPNLASDELERTFLLKTKYRFTSTIKGFTAEINKTKIDRLQKDPRIEFITQDQEVFALNPLIPLLQQTIPETPLIKLNPSIPAKPISYTLQPTTFRSLTPTNTPSATPTNTPKPRPTVVITKQIIPGGISRIGLSATNEGTGIGVAVLDTGIDLNHPDLSINILQNRSCVEGTPSGDDDNGHGTHVAGTIAALNNSEGVIGVAPQSKLLAVKVLNSQGKGSISSLICGIDWVANNAKKYNIKVVNLSLGATGQSDNNCGKTNDDALHLAICKSRNEGLTFVTAAGNNGVNSASTVPASYNDSVITVSALGDSDGQAGGYGMNTWDGKDDTFASFSNFGFEVDLGAPGVDILSTTKNGGYVLNSGTSMAAAHVAGAAALYLKINPDAKWSQVRDGLISQGESLNYGHIDPTRLHPEKVVKINSL